MPTDHRSLGRMAAAVAAAVAVSATAIAWLVSLAPRSGSRHLDPCRDRRPFRLTAPDEAVVDSQYPKGIPSALFFGLWHCSGRRWSSHEMTETQFSCARFETASSPLTELSRQMDHPPHRWFPDGWIPGE
jgi:hypothetical protein